MDGTDLVWIRIKLVFELVCAWSCVVGPQDLRPGKDSAVPAGLVLLRTSTQHCVLG
jgi:hypothetical protein